MARKIFFSHAAEQEGVMRYICLSDQRHQPSAFLLLSLFLA